MRKYKTAKKNNWKNYNFNFSFTFDCNKKIHIVFKKAVSHFSLAFFFVYVQDHQRNGELMMMMKKSYCCCCWMKKRQADKQSEKKEKES